MIYLIRHGEAAASWGEAADPGLSPLGQEQAAAAAAKLEALGARRAYSSPMRRCRETARVFETLMNVSAEISPAVSEIATPPNVEDRVAWLRGLISGGWSASDDDYAEWRRSALDFVSGLEPGSAVFSHFVVINAIVGLIEGVDDVVVFRPANCSITQLERAGNRLRVVARGEDHETRVL